MGIPHRPQAQPPLHSLFRRRPFDPPPQPVPAEADQFTVHRLLQDATRRGLTADAKHQCLLEALNGVNAAFQGHPQDVRTWKHLDPLTPRAETLAWAADTAGLSNPTSRIMSDLGLCSTM
jgi:hypothetical protein